MKTQVLSISAFRRRAPAFLALLFLGCQLVASATSVAEKPLKELVAESDQVLVATLTRVVLHDAQGKELTDTKARTGVGTGNTIYFHLTVNLKDGVLKTTAPRPQDSPKLPPATLVVPMDTAFIFSLESWKPEEGKEHIFLLKGDGSRIVYPAGFMQPLTKRAEIEQLLREPPPPAPDPQLDLHTAMDDLAGLYRAGDFMGAFLRYTPPATLAKHAANPDTMKRLLEAVNRAGVPGTPEYQDIQPVIETLDLARDKKLFLKETGDTATYTLTNDPFARVVLSFVKVDGKWYRAQGLR